jgi:hypothetical protein
MPIVPPVLVKLRVLALLTWQPLRVGATPAAVTALLPPAAKPVVEAGADDVLIKRNASACAAAIRRTAKRAPEINEQIFHLSGQARRGEEITAGFTTNVGARGVEGGAIEVSPVCIALDAEHPRPYLIVSAKRAADGETVDGEITGRRESGIGPIAVAEYAAAVDACIEADPIVERNDRKIGRRFS